MDKLILQLLAGALGLWAATHLVPNVSFQGDIKYLIFAGCFLGLINFFIKPILKLITLPLTIITLGIFAIILNMFIIWVVDIVFAELIIEGLTALFLTTVLISVVGWFVGACRK